jgi:hypothetical protein
MLFYVHFSGAEDGLGVVGQNYSRDGVVRT